MELGILYHKEEGTRSKKETGSEEKEIESEEKETGSEEEDREKKHFSEGFEGERLRKNQLVEIRKERLYLLDCVGRWSNVFSFVSRLPV